MKINAINPEEPFSGETTPVNTLEDKKKVEAIINSSRNTYAMIYKPEEKKTIIPIKNPLMKKEMPNQTKEPILP